MFHSSDNSTKCGLMNEPEGTNRSFGQGVFPFLRSSWCSGASRSPLTFTLLAECVIFVFQALKKPGFFFLKVVTSIDVSWCW